MKLLKDRVAWARTQAGLTKAQLADQIKISRPAMTKIESGATASLRAPTAVAIEIATGVSAEWLVSGKGDPVRGQPKASGADSRRFAEMYRKLEQLPEAERARILAVLEVMLSQNLDGD